MPNTQGPPVPADWRLTIGASALAQYPRGRDAGPTAQAFVSHIFESLIDFAGNLSLHVIGNANTARPGNTLQPGSDVDAIAKDIVVINDDVPRNEYQCGIRCSCQGRFPGFAASPANAPEG
jgi:hypothetical protein